MSGICLNRISKRNIKGKSILTYFKENEVILSISMRTRKPKSFEMRPNIASQNLCHHALILHDETDATKCRTWVVLSQAEYGRWLLVGNTKAINSSWIFSKLA